MIRYKTVNHPTEGMCYCRVDALPNTVEVFVDSFISPKVEKHYITQGYKILRYKKKKCPWR